MAHVLAKDLREAVYQAALEGKLTKTISTDTKIATTTKLFPSQKEELLKKKKMKSLNKYGDIKDEEIPFEIPDTWRWVRINDIGIYKKGPFGSALTKAMFVPKGNDSIKVYEQKNAIQKNWELGNYYIKKEYYDSNMISFTVEPGDIIVSCAGTIGETYIMPNNIEIGIINQALMRMNVVSSVNIDYFMMVFDHILKAEAKKSSGGTAIKNIPPFEVFKAMPIPLPPFEEQARIVSKVAELSAKIDEYEKFENQLIELKKQFPQDMRDSLLKAGMMGKLTNGLKTDTNVDNFCKRISIKDKQWKAIDENELPFSIPDKWAWMRLREFSKITAGGTPSRSNPDYWNGDIPWVKIGDMSSKYINKVGEFITEEGLNNSSAKIIEKGTILYSIFASIGTVGILNIDATTNQAIAAIKLNKEINKNYMYYVLVALKSVLIRQSHGMAQMNINQEILKNIPIPIPSIEEQQRIVDKLDQLLPLCDELEKEFS